MSDKLFGGIEAGGTKFVCAVGTAVDDIRAETRFPTTTPEETIGRAIAFFKEYEGITAVGIGSFGPIDLTPDSPTYGYITSTPKKGWANVDFAGRISRALALPVRFDTDVNGAALGEWRWGAAQGLDNFIYLTIGTGVGGGGMINGELMHGLIHPEMGHIPLPYDGDACICPYHNNCLEGLASGPAIGKRWGQPAQELPPDHPAWELEADYLAAALHSFICTLSPQRIIMGGGVMEQSHLFPRIRQKVRKRLNGYIHSPAILQEIDNYIVPPALGNMAGICGAIELARRAIATSRIGH